MDNATYVANFGDDKDKPFQYDIKKCPEMGMDGFELYEKIWVNL
jgi:hypothetical protein